MMDKVLVHDATAGTDIWMWAVDAEEALRYHASRYSVKSGQKPPKKNPGGRGF